MRPTLRRLDGCAGALLLCFLGLAVAVLVDVRAAVIDDLETGGLGSGGSMHRLTAADLAALDATARDIDAAAPLRACGHDRDAAEVLDALTGYWDGPPPRSQPWWGEPDVRAALRRDGSDWLDHVTDAPRGDLGLTRTLLAYDHWTQPELDLAQYAATAAWTAPVPNLLHLQTLAKLRLLEGLRAGDMARALVEARHMARLAACGEELLATMVGVSILEAEGRAYARAVELGVLAPEQWTPVPGEILAAMKRLPWGYLPAMAGWVEAGAPIPEPPAWARCAVLQESLAHASFVLAFVGERLPGEHDHRARYRPLEQMAAASPCRLRRGRAYYAHPWWNAPELPTLDERAAWERLAYFRDISAFGYLWSWPRGVPGSTHAPPPP